MSGSARGMNFKAPGRPHDIQKVATLSGGLPLDNGVPIQVNKNAKSYAVASRRCTMHLRFHGRLMAWRCDKLQRYGTTRYDSCIHSASFMGRFYVHLLLLGSSWRYPSRPYDAVSDRQYLTHGLFRRLLVVQVMADVTTAVAGGFF